MAWERPTGHFRSTRLGDLLDKIALADNKNGVVLANYVAKYCDDMWAHFQSLTPVLASGAEIHYIVHNSAFYGSLVSTELLSAEMLTALGSDAVECRAIRKQNPNQELVEFDVVDK